MKIKPFLLTAIAASVISLQVAAQTSDKDMVKDVLTNKNMTITWLGADFSHVKILDSLGCEPSRFAIEIVPAINKLVITEIEKFDFGKFLQKRSYTSDIEAVKKSNASFHPEEMVQNINNKLDEAAITKIVSSYDLKDKEGVGVVIIYESLSKANLNASMYLTYINMPDGKVILSKQFNAKPGGFGLRNYWASTIYTLLKNYDSNLKKWKSEYAIK